MVIEGKKKDCDFPQHIKQNFKKETPNINIKRDRNLGTTREGVYLLEIVIEEKYFIGL